MVPVDRLQFNRHNIRRDLGDLSALTASIRAEGVLQSLVAHKKFLRRAGQPDLELIAGHRRLAAAEHAGLARVPVLIVPELADDDVLFAMLGEDQKEPVPVDDRARAITSLHEGHGHSYPAIAERLGISLAALQNVLQGREPHAMSRRRRTSPRAPGRRSGPPRIRPTRVHELCHQWETGRIDGASVVTELRAALGGWTPAPSRDHGPDENTDDGEPHHDESAQTR
ncbi:ParB/RepB/Spo0J family partition protein [Pseudonocardia sediminis]|uniref:ParB/RepB/Spo0J family partition protein n=2 Tax=Pseudonocardia sediminis TaxID=1397368 RepID=A0A4Q7UBR8_PSEST|nr:ParB/RepB/Spo0J family partition protein [Pseudonocardia sediminis]